MRKLLVLTSLFAAMVGSSLAATAPATSPAAGHAQPQSMPRYFEENRGQWPASQAFRAYGYGFGVSLAKNGVTLQVANPRDLTHTGKLSPRATPTAAPKPAPAREVSLRFEGASTSAHLTGLDELAAKGAWFQGAEANWHSEIPLFERVREEQIYPGVNATFYGRDGKLEYDLDIAPGAKAGALIFDLDGADRATIEKNGDLTIEVNGQQLVLHKPLAWQPDGQNRKPVEVSYVMLPAKGRNGQRIGLGLKGYDASKPLTIDPVLTFATYLPATNSTAGYYFIVDLAIDATNNVYVLSQDYYYENLFTVQKLSSAGALLYTATFVTTVTGGSNINPTALRVNSSGQAYVAASDTAGYPTTTNAYQKTYPNASYGGNFNAALSVISADGSTLVYSTYFGGTANGIYGPDLGNALAVDSSGNAYLGGQAGGGNFPTTAGAYQPTYTGGNPTGFIAKFNPSASGAASLVYSTLIGGANTDVDSVAVDSQGNAYLSVPSPSCNAPVTAGALAYSGLNTANNCAYVTAVNPTGTALVYSAYLGPAIPGAIAVDGSKNVYVTGWNITADDFPTTPGAYQTSYADGFALELNPTGGLIYSTFLSGPSGTSNTLSAAPYSIALLPGCSSACTTYISGLTNAADFPVINGLSSRPPVVGPGYDEGFFVALNGTGSAVLTSGYLSGLNSGANGGSVSRDSNVGNEPHVAVDNNGNAWLAGYTTGSVTPDFPVTTNVASTTNGAWLAEVSMSNAGNVIAVPNGVNFGTSVPVNVSSTLFDASISTAPTTIALRNMGSAPVTLSSIAASPSYFAESDNCNGQIAASSYCTATIVFTPPNDTPVAGTLTVTSNGISSPLVVPLSGQGSDNGFVVASPNTLSFGNVTVNTTSAPQTVTLTNVGDEPVANLNLIYFNNYYASSLNGYSGTTNCPASLPPGDSCQVQVTFAPNESEVGLQTATLDNYYYYYYGYANSVTLSGTGVLPTNAGGTQSVALSATTLNFGTEAVGASSSYQYVYLTNTGSETLNFLTPTITLTSSQGSASDFQATTPAATLPPQTTTGPNVVFTPSVAATETATLTYPIAGSSTPVTVSLVGQGMANTQTLEFVPGNAIFPDQPVGTASTAQTFYVFNAGNTPFLVDRVLGSGDFSVTSTGCPGYLLPPATAPGAVSAGGYCAINVVFTPSQTGPRTGTLTVIDAATLTPQTVPLAGNGITAAGVFTATPSQLDFGSLVKGTSSAVQYVYLNNSGDINFNFTGAATTGDYAITSNSCGIPYTAAPGGNFCQIGITFTPTVATSPDNGTLVLTTGAGSETITLTGGGETGSLASGLSPTSVNFGSYQVNQDTNTIPIYVRNSGTETLTFSSKATVTGNFAISGDYCSTAYSGTLAPGQDCQIWIYFAPAGSGAKTGTLTVKSNAGTLTASLSGTGVAVSTTPSYFNPPEGSFDQQAVNSISAPMTVNFYYGGTASSFALTGASITAGSSSFSLATGVNALNTCTSTAGSTATCQVNVVFSPTAAGYETGTLTVTSNAGSFAVTLSGYAPPVSDTGYLSPSSLEFPSQVVSPTPGVQPIQNNNTYNSVTLYNTGATAFTIGTVGGTNFGPTSEFLIYPDSDNCSGQTLNTPYSQSGAGGSSCYVWVQFAPTAVGAQTGTISFPVTYSDGTTGTFTANLTGIGVAQDNEAVLGPTILTFPDTAVGTVNNNYPEYIYLTNSGNLPFNVGQLTSTDVVIGTTTTGDFSAKSPNGADYCSNTSVPVGSYCYILAFFTPLSAGAKTGTVTFPVTYANSSTPVMFTATLTGNGIAANPAIAISPAGIQFDTVTVHAGIAANTQTVSVTNTGNVPVTFTKATVTTGFTLSSDQCTGVSLNPGAICNEYVYFNPATAGTFSGSLSLTDSAPGSPQSIALSGTSLAATSELQFSQTTVSFGNQTLSTSSSQVTINLINRGTDAVTVSSIAMAGTDPGDYQESDNCAGYSLPANETCQVYLTFTPTATGSRTATLTETDSGTGGPRSISISGTGINASTAITFFPAALTFSSTEPAGEGSPQQFFSVTNIGVNSVTITKVASTNTAFTIAQNGCTGSTLTTGQSCLIVVLFIPSSAGADTGFINVTDNAAGSPQQLQVSGTGIAQLTSAVTLTASPMSAAFGSLFTLSAAVRDQNSNPVSNGRVTFYDGTTVLGIAQVATTTSGGGVIGTATLKTILVPLGPNSITATYVGADATSTSGAVAVTVTGTYPSTTTFTSSGSPGDYTFTGTVLGMGPVAPTGSVIFTDSTTGLVPGTAEINSGTLAQTFVAAPPVMGLTNPWVEALADLNGDGIPDLVTGTPNNGLLVQLGRGDGTFLAPNQISTAEVSSWNSFSVLTGSSIVFGDFNGDGKVDTAFVGPLGVGVLLGNGDGTFQKERYYDAQGSSISGIVVGDFNGDGILDIAVANYGNGSVDLLFGNGDGTFQEPVPISMPGADSIAAGDLIGNGKLDLVVTNWGYGTVSVLLGNGNGTFKTAASYSTPVSGYPNNVTLASLRSNGKLDIVLQDYYYGVSVLLGNGNGTFQPSSPVYSPSSPSYLSNIAVTDVNGDGKPDIEVTDSGLVAVSVLLGKGDGTFQSPNSYPTGADPIGVAIADLNHDGRPDIAVASYNGNSATILLNQVTQTAVLTPTLAPGSGMHSVSGAYSGDINFTASTSNTLQLAASLITPTMTLSASPSATATPWGQQLTLNVTLAGAYSWVPAPGGTVSYSIDGGTAQPATLTGGTVAIPISQLSVGNHSIAVSYGGDQYYTTLATQTLPITIIKANQTITFNALAGVTYGVSPITLSATSTSGLATTFSVTSGPGTISGTNSNILTITGAGTVVVAANQAGNADYNAAPPMSQNLAVAQAPLTVTVNSASKAYGAALPTFSGTISGLVNGDTLTATYSSTGTASSPVGTYPITATLSGSALPNYSPTITPGTLTITKVALTVTAMNASRPYNTANPTFTDTIAGFVNGDTQSVVSGAASLTSTATLSSVVGTYPITAALGTLSASNYTFNFVSGTLTITQATPTISWTVPAAITYGTALSATQLDASSTVAGSFVYTPASGAVLTAGTQMLSVTLTPTDTTDYTTATKTVPLTVNKATPTISWTTPAAISFGTALSATQLDATSTVAGALVYSPVSGTVLKAGSQTLSVTFTPTDTTDYTTATDTVTLAVNQVTPTITWATPAAITYGTALSATQLDASSTVAGSFAYTPVSGTVLATGTHTLSVTLTPTDTTDYTTATTTVQLAVNKATLTVTANNASRAYDTANPTFTDTITGFVNGDTQSVVSGAASLTTTATLTSTAGAYPITAAPGTLSATNYTFNFLNGTLTITQATPTITWATPAAITYGTALSATQLDASSTVAGSFAYTPASGTVLTAGTQTLSVTLTPTDTTDYTTATKTVSLTVNKATPTITWATPAAITYGTALSATQLDATSTVAGTFAYSATQGKVFLPGSHSITVTLTPTDTTDYSTATATVSLTVNQATLTVTANNASRAYDTANPTLTDTITGFVNGDTQSVVSGAASLTTTATLTSTTGTYPIMAALGTLSATNYTFNFVNGTLTITQATPTIAWATPAAITYGTALSATQLDASSTVAGSFAYTPPSGTVLTAGTQTLSVTLTPTDTTDYTTATKTVSLTVNKATPTISWTTPAAITYGTALSATQLDATSSVAGTFAYSATQGKVFLPGSHSITVTLTPTDTTDYSTATATVSLTVNQATLTVTANNASRAYDTANPTFTDTITGFVNGDTQSVVSGAASLTTTATLTSTTGAYPITAALGTLSATNYTFNFENGTLTITQATPTITWATPAAIIYGTALSATQLDASSMVAGSFAYTPPSGTVLTAGTQTLSVTLTPTDATDYTTATKTVTLTVKQATPSITWTAPAAITYGTPLSATQLDATSTVACSFAYTPASGTVLTAGTQTLSVTLTPTDTTDYTTATKTVTLTVKQATPTITWATPVAITYGTALSATQLDATSTVAGSFAYTPASGTVLTVGTQTLSVTLTPTDTTDYTTATKTVTLTVKKATPTITWATPAAITYGTALSGTQLDATSSVAGTFAYSAVLGKVFAPGSHSITVTLTPTDTTDYSTATATVSLTVNQATLTVTANNASRAYDTANPTFTDTITGFVNGDTQSVVSGAASLTTTATLTSTAGAYPITAALGTLSATNYTFNFVNGTLTITQVTPTITWATPAAITYGTALSATQLDATSTIAGSFAYTPASGTVLTAGTHTLSVTLTPTDTTDYTTATATVQLTVNPATPTIAWAAPVAITYGTALSATQLDATSTVAGSFAYTPASGTVLTVGTQTLSVTLTPTDTTDYTTATKTVTLTVKKATPAITWATPPAITYGTALSATQLDATSTVAGTFAYSVALGKVFLPGSHSIAVTLTPTDSTDYSTATATVSLTVNQATLTVTANNASRAYDTANPTLTDTITGFVNGDTQSVVSGAASLTTTATLTSTTGTYPITAALGTLSATNYTFNFVNGTLTITQVTPTITWATPAAITYGTALSATQLDATSTIAGSFAYTPASGTVLTVGTHTLSVTLTPTDTTDYTSATATVQLTVNPASAISLPAASTNPLGPGVVSYAYGSGLQASGGSGAYTFVVNGTTIPATGAHTAATNSGGLTFSANGSSNLTVSGTPTSAETVSLAVEAIDSNDSSNNATVTYSVPVTTGPNGTHDAALKGTYTCLAHGYFDSDGSKWGSVSSLVLDGNGNVTSGVFDANGQDFTAENHGTSTGTYSVGSDNNGLATVTDTVTSGGSGTSTNIWALSTTSSTSPAGEFRMVIVNDTGTSPSGIHGQADCLLDTTSAFTSSTINGKNFIFDFSGADSGGRPHVTAGRFDASGGSITTGYVDQAKGGNTTLTSGSITSGSYTSPNATTGRYTLTITTSTGSLTSAVYIVNSGEAFQISTATGDGVEEGHVFTQALSSFSNANLSGNAVLYVQGYEFTNSGSPDTVTGNYSEVFEATGNGSGSFTVNQSYMDDDGSYSAGDANGTVTGTFDTSNPGRVTFNTGPSSTTVVYLANTNAGIEIGVGGGANPIESGFVENQTQTTFTDAALAGNYMLGLLPVESAMKSDTVGELDVTSSGTVTAGASSGGQGLFTYDQAQSFDYSFDSTAPGTGTFLLTNGDGSCAVITSTRAVCTSQSDPVGSIAVLQQ